jgi:hypothetical protein
VRLLRGEEDAADDQGRWAGYVCAGVGGGAVARWTIWAPQEHASQTDSPSRPPSRSPQRWCSATKATRAAGVSGMGRGDYHSVDAPGYSEEGQETALTSSGGRA